MEYLHGIQRTALITGDDLSERNTVRAPMFLAR